MQALRAGFGSVMYDGSREKTSEENIRKSAEIVRIAHGMGVGVECELGSVGGLTDSNGKAYAAGDNGRFTLGYGSYAMAGVSLSFVVGLLAMLFYYKSHAWADICARAEAQEAA